ncbi:MAG TPA: CZB domain-containing protein [Bryobacteraceae bacterium]|nr:CZB domain-containing protein [Bryobacteraceae bacterium]
MNLHEQITSAIGAHGLWKGRIRGAIENGACDVPVNVARDDHQCAFGKWLHGANLDPAARKSKHYGVCAELHRRFHVAAADALALALAGKKHEASRALAADQAFAKVSGELTRAMLAWKSA